MFCRHVGGHDPTSWEMVSGGVVCHIWRFGGRNDISSLQEGVRSFGAPVWYYVHVDAYHPNSLHGSASLGGDSSGAEPSNSFCQRRHHDSIGLDYIGDVGFSKRSCEILGIMFSACCPTRGGSASAAGKLSLDERPQTKKIMV